MAASVRLCGRQRGRTVYICRNIILNWTLKNFSITAKNQSERAVNSLRVQQKAHQPPVWPLTQTKSTRRAPGGMLGNGSTFCQRRTHEILTRTSSLILSNSRAADVHVCLHERETMKGKWKEEERVRCGRVRTWLSCSDV